MQVDVGARDIDIAAQDHLAPFVVQPARPVDQPFEKRQFRRIVLAAVRNVYRRDHGVADSRLDDPRFHVEIGMAEFRLTVEQAFADVQRNARVAAKSVPVDVIVVEVAAHRDLRGLRLQFLQAHDVRLVALHPLAELAFARANPVDVPGGDFHAGNYRLRSLENPASRSAIRSAGSSSPMFSRTRCPGSPRWRALNSVSRR